MIRFGLKSKFLKMNEKNMILVTVTLIFKISQNVQIDCQQVVESRLETSMKKLFKKYARKKVGKIAEKAFPKPRLSITALALVTKVYRTVGLSRRQYEALQTVLPLA